MQIVFLFDDDDILVLVSQLYIFSIDNKHLPLLLALNGVKRHISYPLVCL